MELSELIQRKDAQLEQNATLLDVLTEKEKEQANIIKLLRTNLEIRTDFETSVIILWQ